MLELTIFKQSDRSPLTVEIDPMMVQDLAQSLRAALTKVDQEVSYVRTTPGEYIFYGVDNRPLFYAPKPRLTGVKVLRVENEKGYGPYSDSLGLQALEFKDEIWELKNRGPHPREDGFSPEAIEYLEAGGSCGFLNEGQLRRWFSEKDLEKLAAVGFTVQTKTARLCFIGQNQVIFLE